MIKNSEVVWHIEADGMTLLAKNNFTVEPDVAERTCTIVGNNIVVVLVGGSARVVQTDHIEFGTGGFNIKVATREDMDLYHRTIEEHTIRLWIQAGVDFKSMLEQGITGQVKEVIKKYPEAANLVKGELISAVGKLIDAWKK